MKQYLRVGFWTLVLLAIAAVFTAGVVWLNVGDMSSQVTQGFTFLFLPGLFLIAIVYKEGIRVVSTKGDNLWLVVGVSLIANFVISFGFMLMFPSFSIFDTFDNLIVAILFAIYEETLFLGLAGLMKMAGVPDILIIAISAAIFPLMHAFAYPDQTNMNLSLIVARALFTGSTLVTDNTDAGYLSHVLWNIAAVI